MADLEKFQEEIEAFLKVEGFSIFSYQNASFAESLSELEWSDIEDWKEFFSIAKKENITTIFEEVGKFSQHEFDVFTDNLDNENSSGFEDLIEDISVNLEDNLDEINSISFSWIKNNIKHTITKQASWLKGIENQIQELKRKQAKQKIQQQVSRQSRPSYEEQQQEEVPENLSKKDPNELAKELLEHIEIEHPDSGSSDRYYIEREFWESKGLNHYSLKHQIFTKKISAIIDKIHDKKEKEMIPELVEKCVEWSIENQMDKPTQSILKGYLIGEDVDLSTNNFKILHAKVLIELRSSK